MKRGDHKNGGSKDENQGTGSGKGAAATHGAPPPVGSDDHVRGPAGAVITIVEYGDYDCPHTRAAHDVLEALLGDLGGEARLVFRHFPLRHLHANAEVLAEIVEAADAQGKFWEMHDHLMAHRRGLTRKDVLADAAAAGVAIEPMQSLVGTEAIRARVQADVDGGKAAGVHSTPSFFFNGVLHDGRYDEATLRAQIEAARHRRSPPRG